MIYHISHNDLDGIGCHVVASYYFGDELVRINVNYDEADRVILETIKKVGSDDSLLITDLSVRNQEVIDALDDLDKSMNGAVQLIDHHKSSLPLAKKYDWAIVNTDQSATLTVFDVFDDIIGELDEDTAADLQIFAVMVDDYDMWTHSYEASKRLNILLHGIGLDAFFERFKEDPSVNEWPSETYLIDSLFRLQDEYVEQVKKTALRIKREDPLNEGEEVEQIVVFAEKDQSRIGSELLEDYPTAKFVEIINMQQGTVSLRSRGDYDVSKYAELMGGGGHPAAAGFPLSPLVRNSCLDKLFSGKN